MTRRLLIFAALVVAGCRHRAPVVVGTPPFETHVWPDGIKTGKHYSDSDWDGYIGRVRCGLGHTEQEALRQCRHLKKLINAQQAKERAK